MIPLYAFRSDAWSDDAGSDDAGSADAADFDIDYIFLDRLTHTSVIACPRMPHCIVMEVGNAELENDRMLTLLPYEEGVRILQTYLAYHEQQIRHPDTRKYSGYEFYPLVVRTIQTWAKYNAA